MNSNPGRCWKRFFTAIPEANCRDDDDDDGDDGNEDNDNDDHDTAVGGDGRLTNCEIFKTTCNIFPPPKVLAVAGRPCGPIVNWGVGVAM